MKCLRLFEIGEQQNHILKPWMNKVLTDYFYLVKWFGGAEEKNYLKQKLKTFFRNKFFRNLSIFKLYFSLAWTN